MMRWHRILFAIPLLLLAVGAATAEPKRVLLLHSFGAAFAPFSVIAGQFREGLIKAFREPIDLYEMSLEAARFKEGEDEAPLADHLRVLFKDRNLDLVVVNGAPANRFFQRHRAALFPATPLLIIGTDQRNIAQTGSNTVVVPISIDMPRFITDILGLIPQTENIAVVIGNSPLEKAWVQSLQRDFHPLNDRVKFHWLNGLSFDEVLKRVATLPARSAIFYLFLITDGSGVPYEQDRALRALHTAANAPIFSHLDNTLGLGIVGGAMFSSYEHGQQAAVAAVRILSGEMLNDIRMPVLRAEMPVFDWRELRRWNIDEASLPPGSEIRFRQPTLWEQYRWQMIAIAAAILLQALFIAGLLFERRRRSLAEIEASRRRREVLHLNRVATASVLSSSIAHELNQPLGAILINTETAQQMLRVVPPDLGQIDEILSDIVRDDQRANEILQRQGNLLKKEKDGNLRMFDLNSSVQQVMNIAGPEASKRGVVLSVSQTSEPLPVRTDEIQMQQVILNLVMNGMDSLEDRDASARKLAIETSRNGRALAKVTVSDSGKGIPEDKLTTIFEAFFTTKPHGTGLGLPIARTIIETNGGSIWAENRVGGGAAFHFTLPLADTP